MKHVTTYKTENGKTRKVRSDKNGTAEKPAANNKNNPPENSAKQGA